MRRALGGVLVVCALAAGCTGGDEQQEAVEELSRLALAADALPYKATYHYTLSGDLAPAMRTVMEIAQDPPTSVRKIETTTIGADEQETTIAQWLVENEDGSFACAEYAEGVQCAQRAGPTGVFGHRQVDEMIAAGREAEAFESVERGDADRIAGEVAHCFVAEPPAATPEDPEVSPRPRFVSMHSRFELCYSEDGILLRARRTLLDAPEDVLERGRDTSLLEAVSISRALTPADLRLPGPVIDGQAQ